MGANIGYMAGTSSISVGAPRLSNATRLEWIIDHSSPFIITSIRARAAEGMEVVQAIEIEPDLSYPLSNDDFQFAVNGDASYNPPSYSDKAISLMTGPTVVASARIAPVVKNVGATVRREGIK